MTKEWSTEEIAKAVYTINRHAKTAPKPQHLYKIKKLAIEKLLANKQAKKIGLHFSKNPKLSHQHSTLLIKIGAYYFHIPPSKEDFKVLNHLGELNNQFRNPTSRISLSYAKKIVYDYIGWKAHKKRQRKEHFSSYYTPSSLGKMEWPPTKKFY